MSLKKFSSKERQLSINRMSQDFFDLIIVGGGINGAGIAREACLRGMKVALLEANDFAFGTSSRSSKLIHGGIRYLENLEFSLVFEALSERSKLFKMAPHLTHPLPFLLPVYDTSRVPLWKLRLGLWLYDALALFDSPETHDFLNPHDIRGQYPNLKLEGLKGGFRYFDGYMDDDRLVLETLRSAYDTGHLSAANYLKAIGFKSDSCGCEITAWDEISNTTIKIQGEHVVGAAGPWTDELRQSFLGSRLKKLRPSKGSHLVFSKKQFSLTSAVVMGVEDRIIFAIPRHDMVIVGTTDLECSENPQNVVSDLSEIEYLLNIIRTYFPGAQLAWSDIISSYCGVRPLLWDSSVSVGKTSREHLIWNEGGITWISGGKYTTYRLIAEQVVDFCLEYFPYEKRIRFSKVDSTTPLNPLVAEDYINYRDELQKILLAKNNNLLPNEAQKLIDRFGPEALIFPENYGKNRSYWEYELLFALENTMCLFIKDFYYRRTPLFLSYKDHGLSYKNLFQKVWLEYFPKAHLEEFEEQWKFLNDQIEKDLNWKARRI